MQIARLQRRLQQSFQLPRSFQATPLGAFLSFFSSKNPDYSIMVCGFHPAFTVTRSKASPSDMQWQAKADEARHAPADVLEFGVQSGVPPTENNDYITTKISTFHNFPFWV